MAERRALPFDRAKDDRDNPGLSRGVPLERPLHFDVVAVV